GPPSRRAYRALPRAWLPPSGSLRFAAHRLVPRRGRKFLPHSGRGLPVPQLTSGRLVAQCLSGEDLRAQMRSGGGEKERGMKSAVRNLIISAGVGLALAGIAAAPASLAQTRKPTPRPAKKAPAKPGSKPAGAPAGGASASAAAIYAQIEKLGGRVGEIAQNDDHLEVS